MGRGPTKARPPTLKSWTKPKGGWGHINVDQIEFSDLPGNRAVMALLEELLPARFSAIRRAGRDSPGSPRA